MKMKTAVLHPVPLTPTFALFALFLSGWMLRTSSGEESRSLSNPEERGTLEDRSERVRGDSGRWSDEARLQVSPPIPRGEGQETLDDWADALEEKDIALTPESETWLIHRTEQLDDNDRVWVESIMREGTRITVVSVRATWEGNYFRNFTWYGVTGVNLGKLPPGSYEVSWVENSHTFRRFTDPENIRTSWPADSEESGEDPREWNLSFTLLAE